MFWQYELVRSHIRGPPSEELFRRAENQRLYDLDDLLANPIIVSGWYRWSLWIVGHWLSFR